MGERVRVGGVRVGGESKGWGERVRVRGVRVKGEGKG